MKLLSGAELVDFIMARQAKQVRNLVQAHRIRPTLAIVRCDEGNVVIDTYVRLKERYGDDIGVIVELYEETSETAKDRIKALNARDDVHGIILQLPVVPAELTDELIAAIDPAKDVDSLGEVSPYDAATPMAILWLLAGYNITVQDVALVGEGKLVGGPLRAMLEKSGVNVAVYDLNSTGSLQDFLASKKLIITATGSAGSISADMIAPNAVVVDAGTASENGVIRGDLADDVYERQDISVTPRRGGVGPLTVAAVFDNVLRAARARTN